MGLVVLGIEEPQSSVLLYISEESQPPRPASREPGPVFRAPRRPSQRAACSMRVCSLSMCRRACGAACGEAGRPPAGREKGAPSSPRSRVGSGAEGVDKMADVRMRACRAVKAKQRCTARRVCQRRRFLIFHPACLHISCSRPVHYSKCTAALPRKWLQTLSTTSTPPITGRSQDLSPATDSNAHYTS